MRFLLETEHSYILSLRTLSKVMKWREGERGGERKPCLHVHVWLIRGREGDGGRGRGRYM